MALSLKDETQNININIDLERNKLYTQALSQQRRLQMKTRHLTATPYKQSNIGND
jgi:hypothetical protein